MMITVTLDAVTKEFPRAGKVVDGVSLRVQPGEFFTLLGPSGCGKSTLLRIVGGFEQPTSGRIVFEGRDVTAEPPHRRGIGFAFQNYALFPHLSVADNVAFGLEVRKVGRREVGERVKAALEEVRLGDCGAERVDRLSGGQQQRVALARALVLRPRLLLLDEPLSNLDAQLRQEARTLLRRIHRAHGATIIYVTHDQAEAMAMSDRIAVLRGGKAHQVAAPAEIYKRPRTRFVAGFVGRNNVLEAAVSGQSGDRPVVRFDDGTQIAVEPAQAADGVELRPGLRLGVCVRPESLRLTSQAGTFRGVVAATEYAGPVNLCEVRTPAGTLQVEVPGASACPSAGEFVHLAINESSMHLISMEHTL